tara:strand:- start:718 stop:2196 length:1479 start_codon:yes stop_codon:yes gene_type:complete
MKLIETYGPEREDNNKKHFKIWMGLDKRVPIILNDPMAGGKTYSIPCKDGLIDLCVQINSNIGAVIIDVPRVENVTDRSLQEGLTLLPMILNRPVERAETIHEFHSKLSIVRMSSNDIIKKTLVVLINNTQYFLGGVEKKDDKLIQIIKDFDLNDDVILIQDEYHKGMSKSCEKTKDDMGWYGNPNDMKFVRYKMGRKFLNITPYVIGLSATPLSSMIEGNGKDYYVVPQIPKAKRVVRTSVIDHVNFFDFDTKEAVNTIVGRENSLKHLQNFITSIFNKNTTLNYLRDKYNLKIPKIKTTGIIKLNMNHNERLGCKDLEDFMNRVDVSKNFKWAMTTYEGIRVFEYNSTTKTSTEINCTYVSDQDLYNGMEDPDDDLRFIGVIEKGSLGINIKNLYGAISFRQPSTYDSNGNPVINNTLQFCGRPIRLKVMYEDLQNHTHLSKKELDKIWVEYNSCIYYLPNDDFYQEVYNELRKCYYDKYEVYNKLKKIA